MRVEFTITSWADSRCQRAADPAVKISGLITMLAAITVLSSCSGEVPTEKPKAAISAYAALLQQELKTALQTDGPAGAVAVCHTRAAEIATRTGAEHGVQIGRTSKRVRNPANAPDNWEKEKLAIFEQQLRDGADPAMLSASAATRRDGRVIYRYMQPIIVQPLCLGCHGASLDPGLAAKIDALYPQDQARGYRAGELRGAFSVTWHSNP